MRPSTIAFLAILYFSAPSVLVSVHAQICYSGTCLGCPSDSCTFSAAPSFTGTSVSVADLKSSCTCMCSGSGIQDCQVTDSSGKVLADTDMVSLSGGSSSSSSPSPGSAGAGEIIEGTSSGLSVRCASKCSVFNYSPVIFGSTVTVAELKRSCMCADCSGSNECFIEQDGQPLPDTTQLSSMDAASVAMISPGSSSSGTTRPGTLASGTVMMMMTGMVCAMVMMM